MLIESIFNIIYLKIVKLSIIIYDYWSSEYIYSSSVYIYPLIQTSFYFFFQKTALII